MGGSGIFKSSNPVKRASAIVKAVTHYNDAKMLAALSEDLGEAMVGINCGPASSPSPIATTKRDGVHCLLRPRLLCDILHREETATEIRVRACLLAVRQCILQRQAGNLAEPEPEHCVHLQKRPKRDRSLQHRLSVRRAAPRCLISDEEATLPGLVGACCGSPRPFAVTLCACRGHWLLHKSSACLVLAPGSFICFFQAQSAVAA